jgi:hypothetical protein
MIDVTANGLVADCIINQNGTLSGADNTAALNALISSSGPGKSFYFPNNGQYRFSGKVTPLHASASFVGDGMLNGTTIWYDGSGSADFFDVASVSCTRFADMTIRSVAPSWTGFIAAVRNSGPGDPSGTVFERVNLSPGPASSSLNLDTSIMTSIRDSWFNGGVVGILGIASPGSYSNCVNMTGGMFKGQSAGAIYIGGQAWTFRGVAFEPRLDGRGVAFVGDTSGTMVAEATAFDTCWFGDPTVSGRDWIAYPGRGLKVSNSHFQAMPQDHCISLYNVKGFDISGNVLRFANSAVHYATPTCQGGIVAGNSHHGLSAFETSTGNKDASVIAQANIAF